MKKQVRIFLASSILFMVVGLLDGVFRLMARENIRTSVFTKIYGFHPLLVVFGFIAVILSHEFCHILCVLCELTTQSGPRKWTFLNAGQIF